MELERIQQLDWVDPKIKWLAIEAQVRHLAGHGIPTVKEKAGGRWINKKLYETPHQLFAFFLDAHDRGMSPSFALNYLLRIGDKLTIWGDGANAKVLATNELSHLKEYFEGEFPNNDFAAVCEMGRKGIEGITIKKFSIGDAKRAGLWDKRTKSTEASGFHDHSGNFGSFWYKYPYRMLESRAWSFAARKLFSDALGGLYTAEEMSGPSENETIKKAELAPEKIDIVKKEIKTPIVKAIEDKPNKNDKQKFIEKITSCEAYEYQNEDHNQSHGFDLVKNRALMAELYRVFVSELDSDYELTDFNRFLTGNVSSALENISLKGKE